MCCTRSIAHVKNASQLGRVFDAFTGTRAKRVRFWTGGGQWPKCLARAPFNKKKTSLVPPLPLQLQHPQLDAGQRLPPHQARMPPCGTRRHPGGGRRQTRVLQCLSQSPLHTPRLASGRSRCSLMTFQVGWPHDEAAQRTRHALHVARPLVAPQAAGVREAAAAQRAEAMLIKLGKMHRNV
eukprot:gene22257-biopygen16237